MSNLNNKFFENLIKKAPWQFFSPTCNFKKNGMIKVNPEP